MTDSSQGKYENIIRAVEQRGSHDQIINVDEENIQLVFFSLSGNFFAFYGNNVREILVVDKITEIPGSSRLFLGVINVRGEIDSVLHLHKLLGFPDSKKTPSSRIAIAVKESIRTGIIVDAVENILDIPINSIDNTVANLGDPVRGLCAGQVSYEGKLTPILDMGKIYRKLGEEP